MMVTFCPECGAALHTAVEAVDHYTRFNADSPCEYRQRRQRQRAAARCQRVG